MKNLKMIAVALLATVGMAGCNPDPTPQVVVTLSDVSVDTSSVQKEFAKGSTFNSDGLKVVATYSDDSKKEFTDDKLTVVAPDMTVPGEKTVTVTCDVDGEEKNLSYKILVVGVDRSSVVTENAKLRFHVGEEFSSEGVEVEVHYNNDTTVTLEGEELTIDAPDMTVAGEKTVEVKCLIEGEEETLTYNISVVEAISYDVDVTEAKLTYAYGEEFDQTGVKLAVTYSDEVVEYVGEEELTITAPDAADMAYGGEKTVVVGAVVDGTPVTLDYTITVVYWTQEDISFIEAYTWLGFADGYPYVNGMKVELADGITMADAMDSTKDPLTDDQWCLKAPNVTEEMLEEYALAFENCGGEFKYQGYDFTVTPRAVSDLDAVASAVEYAGLASVETTLVYSTIPLMNGKNEAFYAEEYVVIGLDSDNNLVVKLRHSDATFLFDFMKYNQVDNVTPCFYNAGGTGEEQHGGLSDAINQYFASEENMGAWSQCARGFFTSPVIESDASLSFVDDIKVANPFNTQLDKYDLCAAFSILETTSQERDNYAQSLLAKGYKLNDVQETKTYFDGSSVQVDVFDFEHYCLGEWKVKLTEHMPNFGTTADGTPVGGFELEVYFAAPELNVKKGGCAAYDAFVSNIDFNGNWEFVDANTLHAYEVVDEGTTATDVLDKLPYVITGLEKVGDTSISDSTYSQRFAWNGYNLDVDVTMQALGNVTNAEYIVEGSVSCPADLTAARLALEIGNINGLLFTETGDDVWVAVDDTYADIGDYYSSSGSIFFELKSYLIVGMPDYVDLVKSPTNFTIYDNGAYGLIWKYATTNAKFEITVEIYENIDETEVDDNGNPIVYGYFGKVTVAEKEEVKVPEGLTLEAFANTIAKAIGVAAKDQGGYYQIGGFLWAQASSLTFETLKATIEEIAESLPSYVQMTMEPTLSSNNSEVIATYTTLDGAYAVDIMTFYTNSSTYGLCVAAELFVYSVDK